MWALADRTLYAAERNWTRDTDGVHWWFVVVRATFTIGPGGKLTLADEQLPPVLAPEHHGEPGKSSLRYDSDLLARKPATDVLVLGSAHTPDGKPAATVPVVLRIGTPREDPACPRRARVLRRPLWPHHHCTATIRHAPDAVRACVRGQRHHRSRSTRHRLDERNPVSRGFARRSAVLANTPAHAIECPTGNPATAGPAGFGPIEPGWLPRCVLAGTCDAAWVKIKKPLLPDDYDPAFALCVPADQRLPQSLRGGERLGLLNLSPEGTLVLELPRIGLELRSRFGRKTVPHDPPMLTTVLAEPEKENHRWRTTTESLCNFRTNSLLTGWLCVSTPHHQYH